MGLIRNSANGTWSRGIKYPDQSISIPANSTSVIMTFIVPPGHNYVIKQITITPTSLCNLSSKVYKNNAFLTSAIVNANGNIIHQTQFVAESMSKIDIEVTNNESSGISVDCVIVYDLNVYSKENRRRSLRKILGDKK